MRRLSAIAAALGLLLSFAEAPFAHIHRRDPGHRHATAMPHSHLRLLFDQDVALDGPDDDDDVQAVDWVIISGDPAQPLVAVLCEPQMILAPADLYDLPPQPSPRSHDPPGLFALPPRAPPV